MNIYIPKNFYAGLWALNLDEKYKEKVQIKTASVIGQELALPKNQDDLFLLPSLTLVKNRELFVSNRGCISFDGLLSNSFLYFMPNSTTLDTLLLRGDVSINEILLSKILFLDRYNSETEIKLDTSSEIDKSLQNYLIVGNDNIDANFIEEGISFADQITSLITYPYVDFVLASNSKENLAGFDANYDLFNTRLEENIEETIKKFNFSEEIENFIFMNLNSLQFELNDEERNGLMELLRLPYYHGITEDMFELKFV